FVEPAKSALHRDLVERPNSAVHRLASVSRRMGFPFELHTDGEIAAIRHRSVRAAPTEIFVLVAADFLMLCYQPLRAAGFLERVRKATTRPAQVMRQARRRSPRAHRGGRRPRTPWPN